MKKILFPVPGIRQEVSLTTHQQHQNALIEVSSSIIKSLGILDSEWTVLYGLEAVEGAPNWQISAGAVYHDGEVYLCDGIQGNDGGNVPVLTITETNIGQAAKFSDFIDRHVHKDFKLVLSFAASDSADVNYSDLVRVDEKIVNLLQLESRLTDLKNEILGGADAAFDTLIELQAALGNDEDFAATVTAALATKMALGVTTLDETAFTEGTNWNINNSSYIKKNGNGWIDVLLDVIPDGASYPSNITVATLPIGSRPANSLSGIIGRAVDVDTHTVFYFNVNSNGTIQIVPPTGSVPERMIIKVSYFNS